LVVIEEGAMCKSLLKKVLTIHNSLLANFLFKKSISNSPLKEFVIFLGERVFRRARTV